MSAKPTVDSRILVKLLEKRHAGEVFVSECKTGPSQGAHCPRLDGWAMNKSWANACVTGYEIKVSRSDFLRDDKWHEYLEFCNELYFVTPKGLIDPSEVPAECGLMEASTHYARLMVKKKAPYRKLDIPQSIYQYILMSRVKITREFGEQTREERIEEWQRWLSERKASKEIGYEVRQCLRAATADIANKNESLQKEQIRIEQQYKSIIEMLTSLNIDPKSYWAKDDLRQKLKLVDKLITGGFESSVQKVLQELSSIKGLMS
jgi:hypothetical protein